MRLWIGIIGLTLVAGLAGGAEQSSAIAGKSLPGTHPLVLEEPLDVVMVRGINRFAERALVAAREQRTAPWLQQGPQAIHAARDELVRVIGMPPLTNAPHLLWTPIEDPEHELPAAIHPEFTVTTCRWNAADGITGTGLIAVPRQATGGIVTPELVIVVPDADVTPEQQFGLEPGLLPEHQLARRAAARGAYVLCPFLINRECEYSGHPAIRYTNCSHREYLYRLGFELGLHPVGLEVAKVLTGIRAAEQQFKTSRTSAIGVGEGGLLTLCAAAVDADAIDLALIRGYFDQRENVWQEPIYRNLFGQLKAYGDAELASLIAPRPLLIDNSSAPRVDGPPEAKGRAPYAAPGKIVPPVQASVQQEFQRVSKYYEQAGAADRCGLADEALNLLGADSKTIAAYQQSFPGSQEEKERRLKSQIDEIVQVTQTRLDQSDNLRDADWKDVDMSSPEAYAKSVAAKADRVHETFIGKLSHPTAPPRARSRQILDEPTHVGYEVVLDVFPTTDRETSANWEDPGIIAGGILLLPKDLKAGEKRPVVVCQHGLEGIPMDTITMDQTTRAWKAYKGFATQLVQQGFIIYAPQNPYRGEDEFRVIQRKSNPVGRSLFSYIIEQHRQTLKWLATLPAVDSSRIAFYGLSYGGKTAVRVPNLLKPTEDETGYCLSICSGDYNEWIRKTASADDRYSYVYTKEYEIWEWNMGHIANYAELARLMIPRPFMVERGHDDGVAPDEWVAGEYAKVRLTYDKLGIGDRTEIEFFNGPHTIHGQGTFRFLKRHLHWPPTQSP